MSIENNLENQSRNNKEGNEVEKEYPNDKFKKSAEKFDEKGHLGVTAEDHKNIGGTPDDTLADNPGKTLGELWSQHEIEEWLDQVYEFIETPQEKEHMQKLQKEQRVNFNSSILYLNDIGKLPDKYKKFVDNLKEEK